MTVTLIGTTACGVVLYPERKGQIEGRIDPAIAILDAVGLLFFIVPGVIAFAVDFATGAIYLPGGSGYTTLDMDDARVIRLDPKHMSAPDIERAIREQTGQRLSLGDPAVLGRRPAGTLWRPLSEVLAPRQYAELTGRVMQARR
ncbi:polyribonucleotide nucleotidyltransferase [Salinisphaera sp. T31B1]|uniref:polyribonucleotide nucleotidyltransferase n=1 Tax=Salinisphaera sp. T31B1 TaxID=727963 RepID=UPI00334210A0